MEQFLLIEFKVPLPQDSFLKQAAALSKANDAVETCMEAMPAGTTRTERMTKTGRAPESKPRARRAAAANGASASAG